MFGNKKKLYWLAKNVICQNQRKCSNDFTFASLKMIFYSIFYWVLNTEWILVYLNIITSLKIELNESFNAAFCIAPRTSSGCTNSTN